MDNNDIVTALEKEKVVETMVDNLLVPEVYRDDLIEETYLILLEYDHDRLQSIYDKGDIRFFTSRIITNQINSKTSPFYYKYKRYNQLKNGNRINTDGVEEDDE